MSKRFTSFLAIVAAALLLAVPAQGQQFAKKAKASQKVLKAGPVKALDLKKAKAARMKAGFKDEGLAFRGYAVQKSNRFIQASIDQVSEDKALLERQMEQNLRQLKNGNVASLLNRGKVALQGHVNARDITFNAAKPSARRVANRAEVVDAHGIITSPAEGESKFYTRAGFEYYVSSGTLYYGDQEGMTEIVECTDGTIYIKDFISTVNSGSWVKGTKSGNTITIPAKQVVWFGSSYGIYIAKCTYAEGTGWSEVEGDITLTVDGNTITLDGTDADNPVAGFWTDDLKFSGNGNYETVFTYDPTYVPPTLVELPDGATVETWYQEQTVKSGSGDDDGLTKVAFVGNDVYLSGLFKNFPNSWIKGTISGTTVTFSGLQFLGAYGSYNIFATGSNGYTSEAVLQDFQMTYDADAQTLTSVNSLLANAAEDRVYYLEAYEDIVISKEPFAEPEATTGANVDAVPYSNPLATATDFADFGVLDSNKDGKTWKFDADYGVNYSYSGTNVANDWLISPAIKLERGKKYHFAIDAAAALASYPEKFEVKMGTEPKASALTQSVIAATEVASKDYVTYENEMVSVTETGYYHFGIHCISEPDMYRLMVKNFLVEAGVEADAPAAVSDFSLAQTEGKLEVNVKFTAPTKTAGGDDLTSLTKVDILRDGQVIKSLVNVPQATTTWTASEQSYENAQDVASIDFGDGLTATLVKGTGANGPKYYTTGTSVRMYSGNSITFNGNAIKKIKFTFDTSKTPSFDVNTGTFNNETYTWEGAADAITFTVPGTGQQTRIQKIEVETGLTLTPGESYTYVDNDESLEIGNYTYQVIPYNEVGAGAKSEEKSIFLVIALEAPYTFDLSGANEGVLDLFNVIDNNNDGSTWQWNASSGTFYHYNSSNAADDYLVTLPFNLKAGKNYNVTVNAQNTGYEEKFEVKAGKEGTVDGLTETVIAETTISADAEDAADYTGIFTPAEDGLYYFAIHATSAADKFNLKVSTLSIEAGAEPTAPAAVTDLEVVPGAEGALEATLNFTVPSKAIDGTDLTGTVDMKVYRDNKLIATLTGLTVGSAQTWTDSNVEGGSHTYYVVAANASGDGEKSEKVKVFIGPDEIGEVDGLEVTGTTPSTISLKWNEVTGEHGGYVNLANVQYTAVTMHVETVLFWQVLVVDGILGTVTGQTFGTFDYPGVDDGEQGFQYIGVVATAEGGTLPAVEDDFNAVDGNYTYALLGAPYEMPFIESFTGGSSAYDTWNLSATTDYYTGQFTSDASDDDTAIFITTIEDPGTVQLESGRIKADGENPTLLFDTKGVGVTSGKVYGSKDDGEWTVLATFDVTGDYATVKVPLKNAKGERFIRFAIAADIANPATYEGYDSQTGEDIYEYNDMLLIDNIRVMDLYQYNLVAKSLKANPVKVVAGKQSQITATIVNEGENDIEGYSVKITAGNKVLFEGTADGILEPFDAEMVTATFETSVFDEPGDVTIKVEVGCETELKPEDNSLETIVTILENTAAAPTGLTAQDKGADGVELSWTAPEVQSAVAQEVTEDFENQEVFEPFSLGGITATEQTGSFGDWTVYDGNNMTVYGFTGISFPNQNENAAWQVANTEQVSDLAQNYSAHSGSQFMWSFCPVDENSAPAADHWLISPELTGDAQTISFYARQISTIDQTSQYFYGLETFEIMVSSTDNAPASFTKFADGSISAEDWAQFSFELPAGTKYFAIRHISKDIFGLMVDDVTYKALVGGGNGEVDHYNIYCDGELVGYTNGTETTYTVPADKLTEGKHNFSVTAVYSDGTESKPETVENVDVTTGIQQIANDGKPVDVYSLDGKLVRQQTRSLDGLKGVYVINGKKVMMK